MSHKEEYGEWAYEFFEEHGRDPTLEESKCFVDNWISSRLDHADYLRKTERENG